MQAFTIKDLENLSGIKAHTIRIWEHRYSFLNPSRTDTNIRYYSNEELKTILNIALLNKYGYKISHIDKMSVADVEETILSLSQIEAQEERTVNELIHCMVEMNVEGLEAILDHHIANKGIEKAINQIVFPFLERIGILWLTNHIIPAQEHLVSNIIRQKLIVGIDRIPHNKQSKHSILLFLPEGEHHELGLLFVYYLLKSRGVKVIYLGANVPVKDMELVVKLKSPNSIFTHLTSVAYQFKFDRFLQQIQDCLPDMELTVSGHITKGYKKSLPENVHFYQSLSEVMAFIATVSVE
jgi:DNA-binding transcriptional MerR regulator